MPKLEGEPVVRVHIMLYESDLITLRQRYAGNVGIGPAVRTVVRLFLKRLEENSPAALAAAEEVEMNL